MKSAIEHILNSTSEIFETAWQKEESRIIDLTKQLNDFEVTPEMIEATGKRIERFSSFPYGKSEEEILKFKKSAIRVEMFILTKMFGWTIEKVAAAHRRGVYNTLDKKEYGQYNEWSRILSFTPEKFNEWLQKYKDDYYQDIVSKLRQAMSKYLQGYHVKPYTRVSVNMGVRGYEISCDVISPDGTPRKFYTQAHGAGGWNIQRYHYRYRSSLR